MLSHTFLALSTVSASFLPGVGFQKEMARIETKVCAANHQFISHWYAVVYVSQSNLFITMKLAVQL